VFAWIWDIQPTTKLLPVSQQIRTVASTKYLQDQSFPNGHTMENAHTPIPPTLYRATLALSGVTCSSCVSSISRSLEQVPSVCTVNITLLTNSGVVFFAGQGRIKEIVETIEDCGIEGTVEKLGEASPNNLTSKFPKKALLSDNWRTLYTIGGMTSSSCVGHVVNAFKSYAWVGERHVNLLDKTLTVGFIGKEHLAVIKESIEDIGYTAKLESVVTADTSAALSSNRTVSIYVDGMFCDHCPENIIQRIRDEYAGIVSTNEPSFSLRPPELTIEYCPCPPNFTIRHIFETITSSNSSFEPSVFYPPTIEGRANSVHTEERRRTLRHLILCVVVAIPTFILGIVFMSLVPADCRYKQYVIEPITGNASRLTWALFILNTVPTHWALPGGL